MGVRGLGLGFTNLVGAGGVLCVCLGCGGVGSGLGSGSGWVGWYYVCMSCESGFSVYMASPGICILCLADTWASYGNPVFNPIAPYGYLLPNVYLFMANPYLFVCVYLTWICLDITRFHEEQRHPPVGPHSWLVQKIVNWAPIAGGGRFLAQFALQFGAHDSKS